MFVTPGSRAARKRIAATTGGGAGTPGGVSGNLQFNSAGAFSGILNSSWDNVNSLLSLQTNTLTIQSTAAAPRLLINGSGNLVYGASASHLGMFGLEAHVQTNMTDGVINQSWSAWQASAGGPYVGFEKSRGATVGTQGLVSSGDELGLIAWAGSDGTSFRRAGGIDVLVDGAAAAGSMPGRMLFYTTPTGTITPVERMRIDSVGNVAMGNNGAETTAGGFPIGLSVAHDLGTFWGSAFCGYGNNNFNYAMWIRKTKGTVPSSHVIVGANSELFVMSYQGSNGASFQEAASIDVWVDGTPLSSAAPGGPSMPGRIDFVTNPGPTGSLVRLSIDSVGNTWLRTAGQPGVTPPGTTGSVNGTVSCYNHQVYGGL